MTKAQTVPVCWSFVCVSLSRLRWPEWSISSSIIPKNLAFPEAINWTCKEWPEILKFEFTGWTERWCRKNLQKTSQVIVIYLSASNETYFVLQKHSLPFKIIGHWTAHSYKLDNLLFKTSTFKLRMFRSKQNWKPLLPGSQNSSKCFKMRVEWRKNLL